jgi:hypothetical protein
LTKPKDQKQPKDQGKKNVALPKEDAGDLPWWHWKSLVNKDNNAEGERGVATPR